LVPWWGRCGTAGVVRCHPRRVGWTGGGMPTGRPRQAEAKTMTESIGAVEAEEVALEVHPLPIVIERPFAALKHWFSESWSVDFDGYAESGNSPADRIVVDDVRMINHAMGGRSPHADWRGLIRRNPLPQLVAVDPSWGCGADDQRGMAAAAGGGAGRSTAPCGDGQAGDRPRSREQGSSPQAASADPRLRFLDCCGYWALPRPRTTRSSRFSVIFAARGSAWRSH